MDAKQKRILVWLKDEVDSELAELYEGAVKMIKDGSYPGRQRFICHAVREIRNRLPEAVAGRGAIGRLYYTQRVEELAKACERTGLEGVKVKDGEEQGARQKISQEVMTTLINLISEHKAVAGRRHENARRLLVWCV